jgi:hypothetical protein
MKESITKFDLEAAFKALDDIDTPVAEKGIKANRPALTEIFSRKSKFDSLFEEYYDISSEEGLDDAKAAREAEVAKAKLERIEKIVDLDADSPEDLLTSYVGKYIMQCPQCMTLFYKDKEDIVESEEDPTTVNVSEVCQHCGNETGYTLIGKVGEATPDKTEEETEVSLDEIPSEEETTEETSEEETENTEENNEFDLDSELEELDLNIEDDESEEKKEEGFQGTQEGSYLVEQLTEDTDLDVSASEFEELISSPEFQKPISDQAVRTMMDAENEDELDESIEVNNETLRYAVINPDGTYAGVPCTSLEEAQELVAQKEGRVIVKLDKVTSEALTEGGLGTLGKAIGKKIGTGIKNVKNKISATIDKFADSAKTREEKADWVLANAMEDYSKAQIDTKGQLVPDEKNQKFHTFVIIGYTDKYSNGKTITMAPSFNNKDLIVGKNGVQVKEHYKDADKIAKGWRMEQGNRPAFIYMAKNEEDQDAVFLCEYFKGELANDNLEKYFGVVKKHLEGAELMTKGGMSSSEEAQPTEDTTNDKVKAESLDVLMSSVEELQEASLEKLISDSLVEAYGNVAGFRLTDCSYLDESLNIDGTIYFTSGNTRQTTYTFSEAYTQNDKTKLIGLNEKLGLDKQFTLIGRICPENKTFITESFSNK